MLLYICKHISISIKERHSTVFIKYSVQGLNMQNVFPCLVFTPMIQSSITKATPIYLTLETTVQNQITTGWSVCPTVCTQQSQGAGIDSSGHCTCSAGNKTWQPWWPHANLINSALNGYFTWIAWNHYASFYTSGPSHFNVWTRTLSSTYFTVRRSHKILGETNI